MSKVEVTISEPLPEGLVISETAMVMKCMDSEGITRLCIRTSEGLAVWDAVGMFQVASDSARQAAQDDLSPYREED